MHRMIRAGCLYIGRSGGLVARWQTQKHSGHMTKEYKLLAGTALILALEMVLVTYVSDLEIKIGIVVLGCIGSFVAIGGETYLKTDAPLLKRITGRGWISIVCLLSAFVFGVVKERRDAAETKRTTAEAAQLREQLRVAQVKLDDSQQMATLILEAVPISRRFLDKIQASVEKISESEHMPSPNVIHFEKAIVFDFKDDGGNRVGYAYFGQKELVALMPLKEQELGAKIKEMLFARQNPAELDSNWERIYNEFDDQVETILVDRFKPAVGVTFMAADTNREAMVFYPIGEGDEQLSTNRLTIQRSEILNLLPLPFLQRAAHLADLAEKLE